MAGGPNPYLVRVQASQDQVISSIQFLEGAARSVERAAAAIRAAGGGRIRFTANESTTARAMRVAATNRQKAVLKSQDGLRQVGQRFQKAVVKEVQAGLARPSASTGALAALTGSPRNLATGKTFWGVGVVRVLETDRKIPYALAIEGGSSASVGRRISGYWTGPNGPRGFGRPSRNQRFVSLQSRAARLVLAAADQTGATSGTVLRPIQPHKDYQLAVQRFNPRAETVQMMLRAYGFR
jgi:hypothetical protein